MPDILRGNLSHKGSVRIPDVSLPTIPPETDALPETEQTPAESQSEETTPVAPPKPTREELLALCSEELDAIRAQEAERAYEDAANQKAGEIEQCIGEVQAAMQQLSEDQQAFMAEYAKQLKYLAIEIAQKFTLHNVEENDTYLEKLILSDVAKIKNANWINVEVSSRMVQLIASLQKQLVRPEYHGATVAPVDAPPDTVRIQADNGTTDASISVQAENLHELFEGMEK